ncbi:putative metal-binding motif-containing protein, partial [Corallococcus sp. CA031C]
MYRLCLLGCVLLLGACREKAPDEGALRLTVKYSASHPPACVRVEVQDARGHKEGTDIPKSQFQERDEQELRVAVLRKADWEQALSITVSSFDKDEAGRCAGNEVERRASEQPVPVPPKKFSQWTLQLMAADADGDGHLAGATWDRLADCNDNDAAYHPGAKETCGGTVDFNCNTLTGCQEPGCRAEACDDGNACTQGDHCEGEGKAASCVSGTPTQCQQPGNVCAARMACQPTTGLCEPGALPQGTVCDDGNPCTLGDACSAGACAGTERQCAAGSDICRESGGTCNRDTGRCDYKPLPDTATCDDALACTTPDRCDGNGACVGTPTACAAPAQCLRIAQVCTTGADCRYEADPAKLNTPCTASTGAPGVCLPTGACSPFPYPTSNFDPNTIAAADIQGLKTTGNVTFNSDTLTWNPAGTVQNSALLKYKILPQSTGVTDAVLLPVATLDLGGSLTLVGARPVIVAVFGDAVVNQPIFANGTTTVAGAGAHQQCGTATGANGEFANRKGGGGGGGGNGTAGKSGGRGYDDGGLPGAAGLTRASATVPLVGGCPGGEGGGLGVAIPGKGGAGGGAFQLSVARTLTVSKRITASGRGGGGG